MTNTSVLYHPEQYAQCGDIQLCYDSFGDPHNPPVLLIMGLATQLIHWHPDFCHRLAAQGFWVIRFDNRDIGKSTVLRHLPRPNLLALGAHRYFKTPFRADYTLSDMAKDAVLLCDHLHIQAAHMVGVSMGGMIAQILALDFPERVLSMTAIMSSTGEPKLMRPEIKVLLAILKPPAKTKQRHIEQTLRMWRILHGHHFPFPEEQFRQTITTAYERGLSASGILRQMAAITASPDRTARLAQIAAPSLIIHGDADRLLRPKNGEALASAIPHAKLHIIKGMGHTLPEEAWPEILLALEQLFHSTKH